MILGPLVEDLPEDDNELAVAKAWCLRRLGELEWYLGDLAEARELLSDAQELFLHKEMRNPAASCLLQVATIGRDLGGAAGKGELMIWIWRKVWTQISISTDLDSSPSSYLHSLVKHTRSTSPSTQSYKTLPSS